MKSDYLKWNNHIIQVIFIPRVLVLVSWSFPTFFWIEIDMDFSIAPASNNMLFNHKNAMYFSVWNKLSIWWVDGWINIDWMTDWMIDKQYQLGL